MLGSDNVGVSSIQFCHFQDFVALDSKSSDLVITMLELYSWHREQRYLLRAMEGIWEEGTRNLTTQNILNGCSTSSMCHHEFNQLRGSIIIFYQHGNCTFSIPIDVYTDTAIPSTRLVKTTL